VKTLEKVKEYFKLEKEIEESRLSTGVQTFSVRWELIKKKYELKDEIMKGLGLVE